MCRPQAATVVEVMRAVAPRAVDLIRGLLSFESTSVSDFWGHILSLDGGDRPDGPLAVAIEVDFRAGCSQVRAAASRVDAEYRVVVGRLDDRCLV
jgi:hypothetical protein